MDALRVGIIGAGAMARRHLEVLQSLKDVDVVGVSSRGADRLQKLAEDFHIAETFRNNEEMLDKVRPDAVIVAVNAANVYKVSMSAIERGVSTLLEKPPGLTAEDTADLLKASKRAQTQDMVGLNRRFYSVVQNAQKLIADSGGVTSLLVQYSEDISKVRQMNMHPPEVLEHWMAADAIHCIDLLRFLGGELASTHALSSAWRGRTPNSFGALIRFQGGGIGHFVSNWTAPGKWEVKLYGFDMRIDLSPLEEGKVTTREGPAFLVPKDDADIKYKPGFYRQDHYFVEHVRSGRAIERPAADLDDALRTMRLLEEIANPRGN
jgi:predicted dehydrogenase